MKRVNIEPQTLQEIADGLCMYIAKDEFGSVRLYEHPPICVYEKSHDGDSLYWKQNPLGGRSICLSLLMCVILPNGLNKIITDWDIHDWRILITPKCFSR